MSGQPLAETVNYLLKSGCYNPLEFELWEPPACSSRAPGCSVFSCDLVQLAEKRISSFRGEGARFDQLVEMVGDGASPPFGVELCQGDPGIVVAQTPVDVTIRFVGTGGDHLDAVTAFLPDASLLGFPNEVAGVVGDTLAVRVVRVVRNRVDLSVVVVVQSEFLRAVVDRGGRDDVRVRTAFAGHPLHLVGNSREVSDRQPQRNAEGDESRPDESGIRDVPSLQSKETQRDPQANHTNHDEQRPPNGGVVLAVDVDLEAQADRVNETGGERSAPHDDDLRLGPLAGLADFLAESPEAFLVVLAPVLVELLDLFLGELRELPFGRGLVALPGPLLHEVGCEAETADSGDFQPQQAVPVPVGQDSEQRQAANHEVERRDTPPGGPELRATLPDATGQAGAEKHSRQNNNPEHANSPFREIGWR